MRNITSMFIFLFVFTALLSALYYYSGRRILLSLAINARLRRLIWTVIFMLPLCIPATFVFRMTNISGFIIDFVTWLAFGTMGFFTILLFFVILRDLLLIGYRIIMKVVRKNVYDPSRRQFLMKTTNYAMLGTSALLTGYGLYEARRKPSLDQVTIYLPHLPEEFEGMRIIQFSDLHVGPTIKRSFVQSVVNDINRLNGDMIVFTGDLVDGQVDSLREDVAPLKELSASHGAYFVTGNHEYYSGALSWIDEVTRLGMHVLLDSHTIIHKNNNSIVLAGVTDFSAKSMIPDHVSDPIKALSGAPDLAVKILLAHQPKNIFAAADAGFDLQISGHTHGGQYLPWSYLVTLTQPFVDGLHTYKNTQIYVNRGTGYWGPPLRLGTPSEISILTLSGKKSDSHA